MKSKRRFSKQQLFLFSYVIVFLIPVVTSGILGYLLVNHYVLDLYFNRVEDAVSNQAQILESYSDQFDIIYSESKKSIFRNKYMRVSKIESYYAIEDFLNANENRHEVIANLYFYNKETNTVHTSDGTIEDGRFFATNFSREFKNGQSYEHIIKPTMVQGVSYRSEEPLLMVIMPVEKNYDDNIYVSYLIFKLNYTFLESLLNTANFAGSPELLLFYREQMVYSTDKAINERIIGEQIDSIFEDIQEVFHIFEPKGHYRLSVNVLIKEKEMRAKTYSLIIIQSITLLVVVTVCLLIIIYLLRRYFKPIERILKKVKGTIGNQVEIKDEYQFIDFVFDELVHNNEVLEDTNEALVTEKLLYHILRNNKGNFQNHFIDQCKMLGIAVEAEAYLCTITYQLNENKSALYTLLKERRSDLLDTIEHYEISMTEHQSIVLYAGEKVDIEVLYQLFEAIQNYPMEEVFVGIGLITNKLNRVYRSFNHAQVTAQYALEKDQFICFQIPKSNANHYPKLEFDTLKSVVHNQQIDKIIFVLNNLKDYIGVNNDFFISSCVYNQCIQIIHSDTIDGGVLSELEDYHLMNLFKEPPASTKEIQNRLEILLLNYENMDKAIVHKKSKNYKKIENVIEYIDEHYLEPNFSIKYMAAYMETTPSNLSQYFKKYTGRNISEYLDSLRMRYAKDLLDEGEVTIREISKRLGYSNASAFIKKFKKFTGMTPGDYRQESNKI